jgi:hypothetical protein
MRQYLLLFFSFMTLASVAQKPVATAANDDVLLSK